MSGVCPECPMQATLATAQELAGQYRPQHKTYEQSLGGIAVTLDGLNKLAAKLSCPGPATNNGQLDCPLRDSVLGARNYGVGNWDMKVDLEQIGKETVKQAEPGTPEPPKSRLPGQYL